MYRAGGTTYALRKAKETLLAALKKNQDQEAKLLESYNKIEQLTKSIQESKSERAADKNQISALKIIIKEMSQELRNYKDAV